MQKFVNHVYRENMLYYPQANHVELSQAINEICRTYPLPDNTEYPVDSVGYLRTKSNIECNVGLVSHGITYMYKKYPINTMYILDGQWWTDNPPLTNQVKVYSGEDLLYQGSKDNLQRLLNMNPRRTLDGLRYSRPVGEANESGMQIGILFIGIGILAGVGYLLN